MSTDIMLTCPFDFETYGGAHHDRCLQIGRTGCYASKSNDRFCDWIWKKIDSEGEAAIKKVWDRGRHRTPEAQHSTAYAGDFSQEVDVAYRRYLSPKFRNEILKRHKKVKDPWVSNATLKRWLDLRVGKNIAMEHW